jgi:hypothetical protein
MTPCSPNPPAPTGYTIWKGSVAQPLVDWAISLRDHINGFPYGQTWTLDYNGQTVLARKDYHTWTWKNGVLVNGICIPGITLYAPDTPLAPAVGTSGPHAVGIAAGDTPDTVTPTPDLAMYGAPSGPNWGLVAASGAAVAVVVGLFMLAMRSTGR